jgi:hypothetical protein
MSTFKSRRNDDFKGGSKGPITIDTYDGTPPPPDEPPKA